MFPDFLITNVLGHMSFLIHYTNQPAADLLGGRGNVLFSALRFSAQSEDPGAKLRAFDPVRDPNNPDDLGPVAEPLGARFLPCKRAVTVGTSTPGVSCECVTS